MDKKLYIHCDDVKDQFTSAVRRLLVTRMICPVMITSYIFVSKTERCNVGMTSPNH